MSLLPQNACVSNNTSSGNYSTILKSLNSELYKDQERANEIKTKENQMVSHKYTQLSHFETMFCANVLALLNHKFEWSIFQSF